MFQRLLDHWLPLPESDMLLDDSRALPPSELSRIRLDRAGLIELINQNGGRAAGLDISRCDLSGTDLSKMDLSGLVCFGFDEETQIRYSTDFTDARFADTSLVRAVLIGVQFTHASFWQANLTEASCDGARFINTSFSKTNLYKADLYAADFSGASLRECDLRGANLRLARFSTAVMTNSQIGEQLIQERADTYKKYYQRWYTKHLDQKYVNRHMNKRLLEAADIYMNLRNAYASHGRYRDASKAYLKERRLRHRSHSFRHMRQHYSEETNRYRGSSLRRIMFYLRHLRSWVVYGLYDLSSGYGERPSYVLNWSVIIVGMFTVVFKQVGGIENATTWLDYFNYSLASFSTIGFETLHPTTPLAQTLTSVESLLGISVLALFMFTLGNRINRG